MLVPFEINETVAKEFDIPTHVLDWQRIRILKEIDDIRFNAMSKGNIDLSIEALKKIKFHKLAMMANPVFDASGNITKIDPISYAYDIPKESILEAWKEIVEFIKANDALRPLPLDPRFVIPLNDPRRFQWNFVESTVRIKGQDLLTELNRAKENLIKGDVYFSKMLTNWGERKEIIPDFYFLNVTEHYHDYSEPQWHPQQFSTPGGSTEQQTNFENTFRNSTGTNYDTRPRDLSETSKIFTSNKTFRVFDKTVKIPVLFDALMLQADIRAAELINNDLVYTIPYLFFANPDNGAKFDNVPVTLTNRLYEPGSSSTWNFSAFDPNGVKYSVVVKNSDKTFMAWFQRWKYLLPNGKSYILPRLLCGTSPSTPNQYGISDSMILPWRQGSFFLDEYKYNSVIGNSSYFARDENKYNFAPYMPRGLTSGNYRVRNGYLYSNASMFYELEFKMFSDSILDKLENLISLQLSVQAIQKDIADGVFTFNNSNHKAATLSYYFESGVRIEFKHPVSLKPMNVYHYMAEIILESATTWYEAQKEIKEFFGPLEQANTTAYNKAYQNYLRGNATINGPEALAEFEKKLKTGIFYSENGFDYWRPFTALENKLINKLVQDKNATYEKRYLAVAALKAPTISEILAQSEAQGKYPTDILHEWVLAHPDYYLNEEVSKEIDRMALELTDIEQKVATTLVADQMAEIQFTKALSELFTIKE